MSFKNIRKNVGKHTHACTTDAPSVAPPHALPRVPPSIVGGRTDLPQRQSHARVRARSGDGNLRSAQHMNARTLGTRLTYYFDSRKIGLSDLVLYSTVPEKTSIFLGARTKSIPSKSFWTETQSLWWDTFTLLKPRFWMKLLTDQRLVWKNRNFRSKMSGGEYT